MSTSHKERNIIIKSMMQIDTELSGLKKTAPRRAELVRQKQRLVTELQSMKVSRSYDDAANQVITDHAVLRWLERKHGIDVEKIRNAMLTDEVRSVIDDNPTVKTFWSDGEVVFVIERGTVHTIIPVNMFAEGKVA